MKKTTEIENQLSESGYYRANNMGPFTDHVAALFIKQDQPAHFAMIVQKHHLNKAGIVHGGALMTLLDNVLGLTVLNEIAPDGKAVTISLTTNFVRPAYCGNILMGVGHIIRATRSVVFVDGSISSDGQVIVSGSGIWKRL